MLYRHPTLGDIELVKKTLTRRISLSVKGSGCVRLSYPSSLTDAQALEFLQTKEQWVKRALARVAEREVILPHSLSDAERRAITELLRAEAKRDLPSRMERLSKLSGLRYNRLTIRASKSRWGSCSAQNNISLSLFVVALPEHLRDYIILHELCHTRHHNHSVHFHTLLNRLVAGREAELNRSLRAYSIGV